MPAPSSTARCISVRIAEMGSRPPSRCSRPSSRLRSSAAWARTGVAGSAEGTEAAYSAAARPARAPKTRHSGSELEPSRFAPLMLTQAVSPAAYRPETGVAPWTSVWAVDRPALLGLLDERLGQPVARSEFHAAQHGRGLGPAEVIVLQVAVTV